MVRMVKLRKSRERVLELPLAVVRMRNEVDGGSGIGVNGVGQPAVSRYVD